jgi:dihydroorotate dehydrogenase subfamily 1
LAQLSIEVDGLRFANPFVLASGPPGTNGKVIQRSFELGWGGIVCKTLSLDHTQVHNTAPRYAKLSNPGDRKDVIGFQNIELISDRPFELWLEELQAAKEAYPDRMLIASIMEELEEDRWIEITERTQAAGVDAFELNLSCPHGLPERNMGAAMGQDPAIVERVTAWVKSVSKVPVWAKMTPNITDITLPATAAARGGADGISAINTILCVIGVNLETLRPMPTVEGSTVPGGYSGRAVRPIALRQVMECARACPDQSISGMGGIENALDAAQFLAMGASTVQICTGAMLQGYEMITQLCADLSDFLDSKNMNTVDELVGVALPHFTTHHDLVDRQREAKREKAGQSERDSMWKGDIASETDSLISD